MANYGEALTKYIPIPGSGSGFMSTAIVVFAVIIIIALMYFIMARLLKFKYPVEIWKFDPQGNFQITTDVAGIDKKDGVNKLKLLKAKKKQIDNFYRYPIKTGLLKKQKDKIYLTEENGALRGLNLQKHSQFFSSDGKLLNAEEVYFKGEEEEDMISLDEAELYTRDGEVVLTHRVPILSPANNDSQNAASLEMRNLFQNFHVPQWWEKLQIFGIIAAGIISAIIIYIINKAG